MGEMNVLVWQRCNLSRLETARGFQNSRVSRISFVYRQVAMSDIAPGDDRNEAMVQVVSDVKQNMANLCVKKKLFSK